MAVFDAYVICTAPRSGSTLLCRLLAATGVAGRPESHFHRPDIDAWCAAHKVSAAPDMPDGPRLRAVLAAAIAYGRADTPVFGLRLQQPSLPFLLDQLARLFPKAHSDRALFQSAFGKTAFVHLTREDKVAQAVSYVRAQQSGLWHQAADGTEIERQSPAQELVYDAKAIAERCDTLTRFDLSWERWFRAQGLTPIKLTYAELSADPQAGVAHVLQGIGADPGAARGLNPDVRKLADETSKAWTARFRRERPDLTPPGRSSSTDG